MIAVTNGSVEFEISMGEWLLNQHKPEIDYFENNRLPVSIRTRYVYCGIVHRIELFKTN